MTMKQTGDIASASPFARTALVRVLRCRAAARRHRRGRRGEPLPLLLRRAVRARLPDAHRHSELHSQDRQRQSERRGGRYSVGQSARRHVRARVPDRNSVRRRLRAQPSGAKPVAIGALQRHATDWAMARGEPLFKRAADTGRHVAVVGAGPAGLACAHRARARGPSRDDLRRARQSRADSTNTASPRIRRSTISRSAKWNGCTRSAASK